MIVHTESKESRCFTYVVAISFSVFIFYFLQSNTRYFVNHLEPFTCHYIYIYIIYS